ncbi:hypothetical protein [Microbacterium sp. NPDC087589]|uniref:hypothetical protein n=1 Tax=Microbacterium sp. NPDC087589 TaxID=3364191 RepID=UPI0037FB86AC
MKLVLSQIKNSSDALAIRSIVPRARFRTYTAALPSLSIEPARLYVLDAELRGALLELIHFAEVAMRDSMHRTLAASYGNHWFHGKSVILDDRTQEKFREAEGRLGASFTNPERVVAEVSFGAWGDLLQRGGTSSGTGGSLVGRADYEVALWDGRLDAVFAHVGPTMTAASNVVKRVKWLRNRVAHHEPIVFGIHQPGDQDRLHNQRRQEPLNALADLHTLLEAFCGTASTWIETCEHSKELLNEPLAVDALAHAKAKKKRTIWI